MLHATGLCGSTWTPIAERLSQDYLVMAFDQRGHGDTDDSDRGYSFQLAGEDLVALVQALELANIYAVGHSSGGLSTLIAGSMLPDRFEKVVLVETRVGNQPATVPAQDLQIRAERTRMKRSVWESQQAMFSAYRDRTAFKDWHDDAFAAFIEGSTKPLDDGQVQLQCLPEVEATFYEQRDLMDTTHYLKNLTAKYLLLLGSYPGCQTHDDPGVTRFLELVPGASVRPMGTGSHFLPMEHPDLVLKQIERFFSGPIT